MLTEFKIYDDQNKVDLEVVTKWLSTTYWAKDRSVEQIENSINNSVCYSIYDSDRQIGFARMVSDFATFGYLADVFVDEEYRGRGVGKLLLDAITKDGRWKDLFIILATQDAHDFYKKYGFSCNDRLMSTC